MNIFDRKGFTILELVFVVALLSILVGLGLFSYQKILQNMQVKADRSSATYIVKALRSWYEDRMSDNARNDEFRSFISNELLKNTVSLKSLEDKGISSFLDVNYTPKSLVDGNGKKIEGQAFFVGLIGNGSSAKFVITVETEEDRIEKIDATSQVDYDGNSIGIIYIER